MFHGNIKASATVWKEQKLAATKILLGGKCPVLKHT